MAYLTALQQAGLPLGPTEEFNMVPVEIVRQIDFELIRALGEKTSTLGGNE